MRNHFTHEHFLNVLPDTEPEDYRIRMDQRSLDLSTEVSTARNRDTNMRDAIPATQRLSITLSYLASGMDLEDLQFMCAIAPQTLELIIMQTCSAIIEALKKHSETYGNSLTWNQNKKEIIADVGCANGEIMTDVILPFCKGKIEALIGIDCSNEMLQRANERNKEPLASFVELDVAKKDLDSNMVEKFDRIFSFNCLHMINDQRQCAENLYKMLKPGGEMFLTFLIKNIALESCFTICRYEKWAKYIEHFPKSFSRYFTCEKPQEEFEQIYRDVGFSVVSYRTEPMKHVFADRAQFEGFAREVNLVVLSIPEDLREEFLIEHLELMLPSSKNGDSYELNFQTIVGIAVKPMT